MIAGNIPRSAPARNRYFNTPPPIAPRRPLPSPIHHAVLGSPTSSPRLQTPRRSVWCDSFFTVSASEQLPGLTARLDKLVYHHGGKCLPPDKPHAFVYFITIRNGSDRTVTLLGRKWVLTLPDGTREIIEGDRIVGETPRLSPGEEFSYNSYHVTDRDAEARGCFHGVDETGARIHVLLPAFGLRIPDQC